MRLSIVALCLSALFTAAPAAMADRPVHRCVASTLRVSEAVGAVHIELERTGQTGVASTGTVTITPDSAWPRPGGTWSAAFAPGQTSAFVDVPIDDNKTWDGVQHLARVACGGFVDPSAPAIDSELILVVSDNEQRPMLMPMFDSVLHESDTTQTARLSLGITTPFSFPAVVNVQADDTSAGASDYRLKTSVVRFEPGSRGTAVEIEVAGDNLEEDDEVFRLTLSGAIVGTFSVRIMDDDRLLFGFQGERSYTAAESDVAVMLRRTITRRFEPLNVWCRFEPVSGYGGVPDPLTVSFDPEEGVKRVRIDAGDDWYTGDRTIRMKLFWPGGRDALPADITLLEDDPQPVVSVLDATIREGAAGEKTKVLVTILLSAPLGVELDVRAATTHGTAGAADYRPFDLKRVSIAPGQLAATIPIEIEGDDLDEEDETFTVTITGCCDPAIAAGELTATVTIRDDDTAATPPTGRRRSVGH